MKKKNRIGTCFILKIFFSILIFLQAYVVSAKHLPYLNPNLPNNQRVEDLMSRMSLEDKVAQMCQFVGVEHLRRIEAERKARGIDPTSDTFGFYPGLSIDDVENMVAQGRIGSFLHITGHEEANYLQKLAEKSPLKIPLLIGMDAIHGNGLYRPSATIFPSPIGLSSTWDTLMVQKVAQVTAAEMRAVGYHWTFSPNVDVARDPRWGRVGETFGEDPLLVGCMGDAFVKGYQGKDFSEPHNVLANAKHFIAGSQPLRGLNFSPMDVSERMLREIWLPPFQKILESGCYTVMAAHNELNGIPCHANKYLLTDILRNEYNFNGFVVSDWTDIARLHTLHKIVETRKDGDILSVNTGMDMHMHGPLFFENIVEGVREGRIPEERVNQAARAILFAKFQLGLFENRYTTQEKVDKTVFAPAHRELNIEAARKSMVLLKNEDNILPLSKNLKNILLTGFGADYPSILGDWVYEQPEEELITILEGIESIVGSNTKVHHVPVNNLRNISDEQIKKAVKAARRSDVAIVVAGENSYRNDWSVKTCGENSARASLELFGRQLELIQKIHATGTPVVLVLVNGRPLAIEWCDENIPAILEAWEPGLVGGQAVAETLFGDNNPSGKLTVSFPAKTGAIPCFYNYKPSSYYRQYVDSDRAILYPFGHGLSYTNFEYSNLQADKKVFQGEAVNVRVSVKNIGSIAGDEVIPLFINDEYSSVTTPVRKLVGFKRINLKPGEQKEVLFTIEPEDLSILNLDMDWVIEPGTFKVMVSELNEKFEVLKRPQF